MSTPPTSSRRRTFDLPKSSPDAGLAEWTSRIKAIQQEVDRDEEAEQRRLQDEITRSRMERARRRNTATGSIDWTAKRAMSPSSEASEDTNLVTDRQQHQSDAPRKLAGSTSPSSSPLQVPATSVSATASHGSKPEGISLAAFIGGRATGPRLNKPTPQQDALDPALFDQTRREGPHPIFGRKNEVITAANRFSSLGTSEVSSVDAEKHEDKRVRVESKASELDNSPQSASRVARPSPEVAAKPAVYRKPSNQTVRPPDAKDTEILLSTPPEVAAKPIIYRKPSNQAMHSSDTTDPSPSSQVRIPRDTPVKPSIPYNKLQGVALSSSEPQHSQRPAVPAQSKPSSLAEMIGGRASGPRLNKQPSREVVGDVEAPSPRGLGRALPGMAVSQPRSPPQTWTSDVNSTPPKPKSSRPSSQQSPNRDINPSQASPPKRSFSGSQVVTPSLARPVQPQVIVQPSPVAAASVSASPAFLRAPTSTQELHPSLSRLQGRGFVEKRVKASADIYGGLSSQPRERSTSAGASGKRPTVLDRWQPTTTSPTSPPPVSPSMNKLPNRAETADAKEAPTVSHLISVPQVIRPRTTSPALGIARPSQINESKKEVMTPVRLPGMASPASFPLKQWTQRRSPDREVAEERVDIDNSTSKHEIGKMSTTQLSHPTRERARKPRKTQGSSYPVPRAKSPRPKTPEPEPAIKTVYVANNGPIGNPLEMEPANDNAPKPVDLVSSPETRRQLSTSTESSISRLKNELTYQPPTKPIVSVRSSDPKPSNDVNHVLTPGGRPLPEVVAPSPRPITPISPISSSEEASLSPSRHSRIPSTGQRATVMDVAQALQAHEQHIRESSLTPEPDTFETTQPSDEDPEDVTRTDVKAAIAGWGRSISSGIQQPERRRSAYDRYSVATLPPLAEEKTPAPTPQGSLSRGFVHAEQSLSNVQDVTLQNWASAKDSIEQGVGKIPAESTTEISTESGVEIPLETVSGMPEQNFVSWTVDAEADKEVKFEHQDRPPPGFNLQSLLKETPYSPDPRLHAISVEVLSITGHTAVPLMREPNVFYESEVVAVVYRAKENISGLVSTKVWAWRGKDADLGEKEERKLLELAGRFNTKATFCAQGSEPHELIHVLGGVLAIRQGKRIHWTVENTTMHRVHRTGDSIFVDEIDLAINNLCSAYSYCLSVLDALYVWHGRGSSEDERKVASAYGQSLVTEAMKITEFEEGAEDEMFWMMLGDEGFANANHWKFKHQLDILGSRLYTIDCSRHRAPVQLIPIFSGKDLPVDGVFVVDCRFELFVVVTTKARGKRIDIHLALFLAENISAAAANRRPFVPPVHVVILPSRLPLELQAAIRLCDEVGLNGGSVPNHMNLLSLSEALDHMQRRSWPISTLSDINFLPLGIDPHML